MPFTSSDYGYTIESKGYEGQVATSVPNVMRGQYHANTVIPFGRGLTWDVPGQTVKVISATGQKLIGISAVAQIYEQSNDANGDAAFPSKVKFQFMESGEMYLIPETAIDIAVSTAVYVRHTANTTPGANERVGRFRNNADTAKADLVPNARWMESGVAGKPLRVHIDNPFF